jgi:hypothetical protein
VSIGVYADSSGTNCNLEIPFPGDPVRTFVVASLEGIIADGVVLSVFRIAGLPEGWTSEVISTPLGMWAGDPFAEGVHIGYSTCMEDPSIVLMQVEITPTSSVQDVTLSVAPHRDDTGRCHISTCGLCPKFGSSAEFVGIPESIAPALARPQGPALWAAPHPP